VRLKVEGDAGRIVHSELVYGDALIMVAQSGERPGRPQYPPGASPQSIGGVNTQSLMLFVDKVDEHCARAREAGAKVIDEPAVHDYGADYWRTAAMERSIRKATSGGSRSACGILRASRACGETELNATLAALRTGIGGR